MQWYEKSSKCPVLIITCSKYLVVSIDNDLIFFMTQNLTMTEGTNILGYPILKPKTPVPSDIQVSQDIVKEVGLLPIDVLARE